MATVFTTRLPSAVNACSTLNDGSIRGLYPLVISLLIPVGKRLKGPSSASENRVVRRLHESGTLFSRE